MARRLTNDRRWRLLLGWLRRSWPPRHPVTARRARCEDLAGLCEFPEPGRGHLPRRFRITIARNRSWPMQADALLHEWAHALTWFGADAEREDHGGEFGLAYAELYREFLRWDFARGAAD